MSHRRATTSGSNETWRRASLALVSPLPHALCGADAKGYECFDVEIVDKVGHVKMIRPEKANSMVPSFWRDLPVIVDEMSASGSIRALVLSGEGRHFCSGMDLSVFGSGDDGIGGESGASPVSGHRSRRNERFRSTALLLRTSDVVNTPR